MEKAAIAEAGEKSEGYDLHTKGRGRKPRTDGSDLTGASGLAFNGTPAQFNVISASEIETAVPHLAQPGQS
jgi:hypothetical protein